MTLTNAFIGKLNKPTDGDLTEALGPTKVLWDQLLATLADQFNLIDHEWNSYSPKAGWALRLKRKKRNIVYLSPYQSCFFVSFVLGDKAIQAARQSKLPKRVIKIIDEAKRYSEGTGFKIQIKKPKDIDIVSKLTAIKLDN
jgi:hypothetical protein